MKRYFAFLTFSLLASTAVVKAGGFDFEKTSPGEKTTKSRALKTKKYPNTELQKNAEERIKLIDSSIGGPKAEDISKFNILQTQKKELKRRIFKVRPVEQHLFLQGRDGDTDRAQNALNGRSFSRYDVKGDGDCLFYALQDKRETLIPQLIAAGKGDTDSARNMREQFRNGVLESLGRQQEAIDPSVHISEREFETFLQQFNRHGEWAPYEVALAYGVVNRKNVYVWQYQKDREVSLLGVSGRDNPESIHLGYVTPYHFQRLVLEGERDTDYQKVVSSVIEQRARESVPLGSPRLFLTPEELDPTTILSLANPAKGGVQGSKSQILLPASLEKAFDKFDAINLFPKNSIFRLGVKNTLQYASGIPQVPVCHPYVPNEDGTERTDHGVPQFPYAAKLDPSALVFLPGGDKVLSLLKDKKMQLASTEVCISLQTNPWKKEIPLQLKPQPWMWPDVPTTNKSGFNEGRPVEVALVSNGKVQLKVDSNGEKLPNSEFGKIGVSVHTGGDLNPTMLISSGNNLFIDGLGNNQTDFFYSVIVDSQKKKIAVTLHGILSDKDFEDIQKESPKNLKELIDYLKRLPIEISVPVKAPLILDIKTFKTSGVPNTIAKKADSSIQVTTDKSTYAYQLMSDAIPVDKSAPLLISFEVNVEQGGFGVGLLSGDQKRFLTQKNFDKLGLVRDVLELPAGSSEEKVILVFYNNSPVEGVSKFTVQSPGTFQKSWERALDIKTFKTTGVPNTIDKKADGSVQVTTDKSTYAYQLMSGAIPVDKSAPLRIPFEVDVEQGGVGVGLLSGDQSRFFTQQNFSKPGLAKGVLELPAGSLEEKVILVFYNNSPQAGVSKFTIRKLL